MLSLTYISQLFSFHLDLCSIFLYAVLKLIFQTYFFPLLGDLFIFFNPCFSLNVCPCFLSSHLSFRPLRTFTLIYFPTHSFCKVFLNVPKSACSVLRVMQLAAIGIYYLLVLMDFCICCSIVRCTAVDKRASDWGMKVQIKLSPRRPEQRTVTGFYFFLCRSLQYTLSSSSAPRIKDWLMLEKHINTTSFDRAVKMIFPPACSPLVEEENPQYWRSQAQKTLQSVLDRKLNTNVAKNILFFLGDGRI